MADRARNGRPAALFIAPIMPSDRGNGLAMRTGFLLDSYAKRFEVDLAVVPWSRLAPEDSRPSSRPASGAPLSSPRPRRTRISP